MNRIEIECKLNSDRTWLLQTLSAMSPEDLNAPRTPSEHDASKTWSYADHFIHTTLIEQNWNAMFRRHITGEQGMQLGRNSDGSQQPREQMMAGIHKWTEAWAEKHRGKSLNELVAAGLASLSASLRSGLGHVNVRGLDVAMHEADGVGLDETARGLGGDAHDDVGRERAVLFEELLQILAAEKLHDEEGNFALVVVACFQQPDDMGRGQCANGAGLALEAANGMSAGIGLAAHAGGALMRNALAANDF